VLRTSRLHACRTDLACDPVSNKDTQVGMGATITSGVLLVIAIAGVIPYVRGGAAGGCAGEGPHAVFLIAWGAAAIIGLASAIHLSTSRLEPKGPPRRRIAFLGAVAVVVAAAGLFVVVVLDGLRECGF
jgi:hypothetical protein